MNYRIKSGSEWTEYSSEVHPLLDRLEILYTDRFPNIKKTASSPEKIPEIPGALTIAAVGAGGKTSLLLHLAKECAAQNKSTLVSTTTHMFLPGKKLTFPGITCLGTPVKPTICKKGWIKCAAPSPAVLEIYRRKNQAALIEADGSRRLPIKIPGSQEPVIPEHTDIILAVYGLSSLGQALHLVCHRWELLQAACLSDGVLSDMDISSLSGRLSGTEPVTPKLLAIMMREFYLRPLTEKYPNACILPVWNQADTPPLVCAAQEAADYCGSTWQLITHFSSEEQNLL